VTATVEAIQRDLTVDGLVQRYRTHARWTACRRAEEYDPATGRLLGNFPQAFSHVALVNSALNLCGREKPAVQRAEKRAA
jgi:GH15 family glucan-1,4-alpha-glucosidase